METEERLKEFLNTTKKEAIVHRRIAKQISQEASDRNDGLDDAKFHDGQSAMACKLKVKFELLFSEELKR